MKRIKLYEEFIAGKTNEATTPEDSKVDVDDFTTDAGLEIKSTEIVGAMVSNATEKEFKDYFYDTYGMNVFTDADMGALTTYYNDYREEVEAEETEKEEEEKDGGDDPLAGLGMAPDTGDDSTEEEEA